MDETLLENEEKYRNVVELANDGICIIQDGIIKYLNRHLASMWNSTVEEIIDTPFFGYIDPGYQRKMADRYKQRMAGKHIPAYEITLIRKDGSRLYVEVNGAVVIHKGKQADMLIVRDITERKQTEAQREAALESLRRAEENFRRTLDDSPFGVRIVTAEGETIYANQAIMDIYGYDSIEEIRTTPIKNRYTPESYAEFQIRYDKRRQGEESPSEYEISIVKKNGEVRRLQVFRKEVLWNDERQYQVLYHDITERKRAEETLAQEQYLMRTLMDNLPDHIYFKDHASRIIRINKAMSQFLGLNDSKQAFGKTDFDFFTEEHARQTYEDEQTIIRTGQMLSIEEK